MMSVRFVLMATLLAALPSTPPDLSGRWRFEADKSDDAGAKLREALASRQGTDPGPSETRHHGGGGGHHERSRPSPAAPAPDAFDSLTDVPRGLTITQTATEVAVLGSDGSLRTFHPSEGPSTSPSGAEVKAAWEGVQLVVETRNAGTKVTETFEIAGDRTALTVTVRFLSPTVGPLTVRRVYAPQTAEDAPVH
jgi:hypothetical protein